MANDSVKAIEIPTQVLFLLWLGREVTCTAKHSATLSELLAGLHAEGLALADKSVVLASGVPSDRYTGPQSQLFKKRPYEDKPPVTIDVPAKLQRTGKNWHFNFGLF